MKDKTHIIAKFHWTDFVICSIKSLYKNFNFIQKCKPEVTKAVYLYKNTVFLRLKERFFPLSRMTTFYDSLTLSQKLLGLEP